MGFSLDPVSLDDDADDDNGEPGKNMCRSIDDFKTRKCLNRNTANVQYCMFIH